MTSAGAGSADGSSEANARSWANMVSDINAGGTGGNRYNVKGAITAGAPTFSSGGSTTSPVIIRGYSSVIGDGYLGRTNGNGPLITTNMPVLTVSGGRIGANVSNVIFESVAITGSNNDNIIIVGTGSFVVRSTVVNTNTGSSTQGVALQGNGSGAIDSDVTASGASGQICAIDMVGASTRVQACRVRSVGKIGIRASSNGAGFIAGNVIYNCGTSGIETTGTGIYLTAFGNTIVGCVDGINLITGTTVVPAITNNLITDNSGYGINGVSAANAALAMYNRLDRNTLGATNLATNWLLATSYGHNLSSVTQSQEYVNAAGNDYRLLSTSPALANGLFAYLDIGAVQSRGGGGASKGRLANA